MAEKAKILEILRLENDEEYTVEGYIAVYRFHDGRRQYKNGGEWSWTDNEKTLLEIINYPSLIQRKPRFTDEEITFLRLLRKYGKVRSIEKNKDDMLRWGISSGLGLAPNIGELLKTGETIDLEEMFKEVNNG